MRGSIPQCVRKKTLGQWIEDVATLLATALAAIVVVLALIIALVTE